MSLTNKTNWKNFLLFTLFINGGRLHGAQDLKLNIYLLSLIQNLFKRYMPNNIFITVTFQMFTAVNLKTWHFLIIHSKLHNVCSSSNIVHPPFIVKTCTPSSIEKINCYKKSFQDEKMNILQQKITIVRVTAFLFPYREEIHIGSKHLTWYPRQFARITVFLFPHRKEICRYWWKTFDLIYPWQISRVTAFLFPWWKTFDNRSKWNGLFLIHIHVWINIINLFLCVYEATCSVVKSSTVVWALG